MKTKINFGKLERLERGYRSGDYARAIAEEMGITQRQGAAVARSSTQQDYLGLSAGILRAKKSRKKIATKRMNLLRPGPENPAHKKTMARRHWLALKKMAWEKWEKISPIFMVGDKKISYNPIWWWNPQTTYQRRHGFGSGFLTNKNIHVFRWDEKKGKIVEKIIPVVTHTQASSIIRKMGKESDWLRWETTLPLGIKYNREGGFFWLGTPGNNFHAGVLPADIKAAAEIFSLREREARKTERNSRLDVACMEGRVMVLVSDSLEAGNCSAGTDNMRGEIIYKFFPTMGKNFRGISAAALLALRDDDYTRRACRVAALRQGF